MFSLLRAGICWQIEKQSSNESVGCQRLDPCWKQHQQHEHKSPHLSVCSSHSCRLVCLNMRAYRRGIVQIALSQIHLQTHTLINRCTHTNGAAIQVGFTTLLLDWHSSRLKQVSEPQKRQSESNASWRDKNSRDLRRYSTPRLCGIFPLKHNKDLTNMSPTEHSLNGNRSAYILLSFCDNRSQTWGKWSLNDAWWAQRTFSLCKWSI